MATGARYLTVKVKPNARASLLREAEGGLWQAELKAPPVDGKANAELIRLLAKHFGCPRSAVVIKTGGSGRTKLVRIEALDVVEHRPLDRSVLGTHFTGRDVQLKAVRSSRNSCWLATNSPGGSTIRPPRTAICCVAIHDALCSWIQPGGWPRQSTR